MREFGTEYPWSGDYVENTNAGDYLCKACDQLLFASGAKFTAECGWPAFSAPVSTEALEEHDDRSQGMIRREVRCTGCGSHLGFLFRDGPDELGGNTGNRYCINSIALVWWPPRRPAARRSSWTRSRRDGRFLRRARRDGLAACLSRGTASCRVTPHRTRRRVSLGRRAAVAAPGAADPPPRTAARPGPAERHQRGAGGAGGLRAVGCQGDVRAFVGGRPPRARVCGSPPATPLGAGLPCFPSHCLSRRMSERPRPAEPVLQLVLGQRLEPVLGPLLGGAPTCPAPSPLAESCPCWAAAPAAAALLACDDAACCAPRTRERLGRDELVDGRAGVLREAPVQEAGGLLVDVDAGVHDRHEQCPAVAHGRADEGVVRQRGVAVLHPDHAGVLAEQPVLVVDLVGRVGVAGEPGPGQAAVGAEARVLESGARHEREVVGGGDLAVGVVAVGVDHDRVVGVQPLGRLAHQVQGRGHAAGDVRERRDGVVAGAEEDPVPQVGDAVAQARLDAHGARSGLVGVQGAELAGGADVDGRRVQPGQQGQGGEDLEGRGGAGAGAGRVRPGRGRWRRRR